MSQQQPTIISCSGLRKTYRMGGFEDEKALLMAMEDGMEIMMTLQMGKTLNELRTSGKRNAYKTCRLYFWEKRKQCIG
jgi:hypothetical protein